MWFIFLLYFIIVDVDSLKNISNNSASLNTVIDEVTKNIQTKGKDIGLDSFTLPDIYKKIDKGAGNSQIFNLTNGVVYNLTSIERYENSEISYNLKVLNVKVGFHFTGLQVNYDFNIHAWNLNPIGVLKGGLDDFRVKAEATVDLNSFRVALNNLEIPTTGNLDFTVNTTVPIYGYIIHDLITAVKLFQDIIIYEVSQQLTKKIDEILHDILKVVEVS